MISLNLSRQIMLKLKSMAKNNHIAILKKEILLAEEKMKYSIAMKPIVVYLQKRIDELNEK